MIFCCLCEFLFACFYLEVHSKCFFTSVGFLNVFCVEKSWNWIHVVKEELL